MSAPVFLAEFATAEPLVAAARRLRDAGLGGIDAHTPFPLPELASAVALPTPRLGPLMLGAGAVAAMLLYWLCWYAATVAYPLNLGGRPQHAWPAFLVMAFEAGLLGAAVAGFLGFLWACGLPRLHHPLFEDPGFARASQDRFLLSVADPGCDQARLEELLRDLSPLSVRAVPEAAS